jgi:transcription elongation factor Elf1
MTDYSKEVKKYIKSKGICCPFCDSENLDAGTMQTDAGIAWQDIECCNCGSSWRDEYELIDMTNIDKKNKVGPYTTPLTVDTIKEINKFCSRKR